jgi:hypothetical protein
VPLDRLLRRIFAPLIALTSSFAVLIAIAPAAQAEPTPPAQEESAPAAQGGAVCYPVSCFAVTVNITMVAPSMPDATPVAAQLDRLRTAVDAALLMG